MRQIFLAVVLVLISGMAHAASPATPQPTKQQAARVETDAKTGAVKVMLNDLKTRMVKVYIDNHEVARFGPGTENCTPDSEGVVRYSNKAHAIQFCDGKAWITEELPVQTSGK